MDEFIWNIDLASLLLRKPRVKVETTDGMFRRGVLTDVLTKTLPFMGKDVVVPLEIELNGDPESRYPLDRLKIMEEIPK